MMQPENRREPSTGGLVPLWAAVGIAAGVFLLSTALWLFSDKSQSPRPLHEIRDQLAEAHAEIDRLEVLKYIGTQDGKWTFEGDRDLQAWRVKAKHLQDEWTDRTDR
jgi:hypothetical protein